MFFVAVDVEAGNEETLVRIASGIERDWLRARTQEANKAFYQRLRSKYTVRIDDSVLAAESVSP